MKQCALRLTAAALLLVPTLSFGQTLVASSTTAQINTMNHISTISYTPGADSGGFDFVLTYDSTRLTTAADGSDITPSIPNSTTVCSVPVLGTISCNATANSPSIDLGAGSISISFDVGATTGVAPLNFMAANFSDQGGNPEAGTTTNGMVTVTPGPVPEFDAAPAPGPRTVNGAIGSDGSEQIAVSNIGDVGSTLTVAASATDVSATGTLSVAPANASIAQGAGPTNFTVTCSSTIAETFTGTVTFMTNDSDEGTVTYDYTCIIAATPTPEFDATPAPPGPILISDAVGGGGTSATITVSNVGNADLTVAPSGLSGILAVTPTGTTTIAPAGMQVYTITCTATSGGVQPSQTLSFDTNDPDDMEDPVTYTVTCTGVAPEYESVPAAPGPIAITDVAGDGMGTTGTLTVNNIGTGDLTVTPSGLSGILSIAPTGTTTIMAAGTQAYTITCNAVDAVDATQTLTMTTNDADEGTVTYTVTCNATGPEVGSTPASGGTVNFSGFPGNTANQSVLIQNTGDALLTISGCMLGGTNPGSFTAPAGTTVPAGGTGSLALTCTVPAAGTTVTATLTCATDDLSEPSITFNLTCLGINPSIPTLNDYGKLLMIAMVLGLGLLGFALRRQA